MFRKVRVFYVIALCLGMVGVCSVPRAHAATSTVCASGCDYPTITAAIAASPGAGDVIAVGASYASTTETFTFNIPTGVTLDCQNSGATIGTASESNVVNINSQSDNIVRNCTFSNVMFENTNQSNVQILNNTWKGNSRITANNASDIVISGNAATGEKGLQNISIANSSDVTITANTIMSYTGNATLNAIRIESSTSVQITSNIVQDNTTTTNNNYSLIDFLNGSYDVYFATNTVTEPYLVNAGSGMSVIQMQAQNVRIQGNVISLNGGGGGIGLNLNANSQSISAIVRNNTFIAGATCYNCNLLQPGAYTTYTIQVTSTYNLFVGYASSSSNNGGHNISGSGPSANLVAFSEYEGFAGSIRTTNDSTNFPIGAHPVIRSYPALRTDDATSTNDYEQAPWSAFLDVNGTLDIGARSGIRDSSFQVNASGTVDYTSVDATNTTVIITHLRSNDTVNLSAGSYAPISLVASSTNVALLSGVSILGAGSSTIIQGSASSHAVSIDGMQGAVLNDLALKNSSATVALVYTMTRALYNYNSNSYDDSANVGAPANVAFLVPPGCSSSYVSADGTDISSFVGNADSNWHLALVDYSGSKLTAFVKNSDFSTASSLATGCGATVDLWVPNVFTVSSGVFTYQATDVANAGATMMPGLTDPASITRTQTVTGGAGLYLKDASGILAEDILLDENTHGIRFTGTSHGNTLKSSTITDSSLADVHASGSGNNTLEDVAFTRVSSTVTGAGSVRVRFTARAMVQTTASSLISGASVTFQSANAVSSTTLTTGGTGYTAYTVSLPAYTMTSASIAETSGGFNPYTISVTAGTGYQAGSTNGTLNTPRQSFTLSAVATQGSSGGGGGGPSGIAPHGYSTPGASIQPELVDHVRQLGFVPHQLVKLPDDGDPHTQLDSTVYYLGIDGRRHAFPNAGVYFSWYCSFQNVQTIRPDQLARIPLGRNVTQRPGLRLVKFPSVPTVYLVQTGGILRPIASEDLARQIAGADWSRFVTDISEAFYRDYAIGTPIESYRETDRREFEQTSNTISGSMNFEGYHETPLIGILNCHSTQ